MYGAYNFGAAYAALGTMALVIGLIGIACVVLYIIGMWKLFEKAGRPGWGALIPFYNTYLMYDIAGNPNMYWFVLGCGVGCLIPYIGFACYIAIFVLWILMNVGLSKNFNVGGGFAVGLILLPSIFLMILGFSKNIRYTGGETYGFEDRHYDHQPKETPQIQAPVQVNVNVNNNRTAGTAAKTTAYAQSTGVAPTMAYDATIAPAAVVCLQGSLRGKTFNINAPTIVGRDPKTCKICVASNETTVSRNHCRLIQDGNTLLLTDLNSSCGTYIGGRRLKAGGTIRLKGGMRFTLGKESSVFMVRTN